MTFELDTAAVITANLLGGSMAMPQAIRVVRTRRVAGISPAWAAMSAIINAWWGIYAIGVRDIALGPVSAVSVLAYGTIVVFLVRSSSNRQWVVKRLAIGSFVALAPIPALLLGGWSAAGLTLGMLYAVQLAPAVIEVYRSDDVSGVSAATWALAWLEAAMWGIYGLPRADAGLITLAVTGIVMSSLVLARLLIVRTRRQPVEQLRYAT